MRATNGAGHPDEEARCGGHGMGTRSGTVGSMPERVVLVCDDAMERGGAAMIALTSARLLRERGCGVTLLSGEADREPDLAEIGIEGCALGGRHLLEGARASSAIRAIWDFKLAARLSAWISEHDTPGTLYHVHNWHKVLSPAALAALRPVSRRLVLTAHDFFLACPNGGYYHYPADTACELRPMSLACLSTNCDKRHYSHKLWRVLRHKVRQSAIDLAQSGATVIAVHEGMLSLLERGGVPRHAMRVLRNPVVPWQQRRVDASRNATVLYVGRLELDKGIDVLAEAARQASVGLCVVGDGPLRAQLQAEHPGVKFCGRLAHHELATLALESRLVVVPTRVRETFSLVAIEALMSGLPVVITSTAMLSGEIVGQGLGRVVPPGSVDALAHILLELTQNDSAIEQMSRAAFTVSKALAPTCEVWCEALLALYAEKLSDTAQAASGKQPDSDN